jgi:NTP pyrophosphatase (non-canonical NTP hydrolase)
LNKHGLDEKVTVGELKRKVDSFIMERDWLGYQKPKDLAVSIVLEASELLEKFQWLTDEEVKQALGAPEMFNEVKSELADVVTYTLNLSSRLEIDLSAAVLEKIKENEHKYPVEKVKGNYRKYSKIK